MAALWGNHNMPARTACAPLPETPFGARALPAARYLQLTRIRWGTTTMFEFRDLCQWDRFSGPDWTETGNKTRKQSNFSRMCEGSGLTRGVR